jgi:hypothetical protein
MGTFTIKSRQTTTRYEYENEQVIAIGNYTENTESSEVLSISGEQRTKDGQSIGNFNGYKRNGEMVFSYSEVPQEQLPAFQQAVTEIVAQIIPAEGGAE